VAEACLTQPLSPTLTHVVVLGSPPVNESIVIAMISPSLFLLSKRSEISKCG
jgi:hypothetical protein